MFTLTEEWSSGGSGMLCHWDEMTRSLVNPLATSVPCWDGGEQVGAAGLGFICRRPERAERP
jgi:hypothetical protein